MSTSSEFEISLFHLEFRMSVINQLVQNNRKTTIQVSGFKFLGNLRYRKHFSLVYGLSYGTTDTKKQRDPGLDFCNVWF